MFSHRAHKQRFEGDGILDELHRLRRHNTALTSKVNSLQRELARAHRRIRKLETDNHRLEELLESARRDQFRQAHPFAKSGTAKGNADPRKNSSSSDSTGAGENCQSASNNDNNENASTDTNKEPGTPQDKGKKKPGRKGGHRASNRSIPEHIDRVIHVPVGDCPDCHVEFANISVNAQYQTDLPPIRPIVTQFNVEVGYCPCCGKRGQGRHRQQISDALEPCHNQLGPRILAMAAELKHRFGVSYAKIADFFETYLAIEIAPSTLCRAEQRLRKLAEPTYKLLTEALRSCGVVHADETGWKIHRQNAWLWVFSSQNTTIYAIRTSRGHEVPEEILGKSFNGILIVDGFAAYDVLDCAKGRCNSHILHRCKRLIDDARVSKTDAIYIDELAELLRKAISLARRREKLTDLGYARRVSEIETCLERWIEFHGDRPGDELRKLAAHVDKNQVELLWFLHDPDVPPTNNHGERQIRPAVIARKLGGCNKTLKGALTHEVLASLMATCKQRGKRFLDLALRLFRPRKPQPIDLETLPTR